MMNVDHRQIARSSVCLLVYVFVKVCVCPSMAIHHSMKRQPNGHHGVGHLDVGSLDSA